MTCYLGYGLLALPFLAIFTFTVRELGLREAVGIFAAVGLGAGIILLGSWLIRGGCL